MHLVKVFFLLHSFRQEVRLSRRSHYSPEGVPIRHHMNSNVTRNAELELTLRNCNDLLVSLHIVMSVICDNASRKKFL